SSTSKAEGRRKEKRLSRSAAEGTGKRRSDIGGDDDLFGRFLRLHLFAAARSDPGRRIRHATVLDDVLDLRAIKSLELKQRFGDNIKFVTIGGKNLLRPLVRFVEERAHFAIDLFGSGFAVIARARDVAPEENVIFVVAVLDHAQFFSHAPFAHHPPGGCASHFDIYAGPIGCVSVPKLLGYATAHAQHGACDDL